MSPLRKKTWWQKLFLTRLTLIFLIVTSIGLSFAVYDRYTVEREMAVRRESREVELLRETERQEALREKVEYLSDNQGMEAEIRRHFDVAMEGEQVVVILGEENEVASSVTPTIVEEEVGFWQRIFPW